MKKKRKLYHVVPSWVQPGAIFHIRIRCDPANEPVLTESVLARSVLRSAAYYNQCHNWYARLFLLMPDHIHPLISFPPFKKMSEVVGAWKSYSNRENGVLWQGNYFDHRIRSDESFDEKAAYIRNNPVAKGLCTSPRDWQWVLDAENAEHWL
jgi:putative transposase